jgi:hypothetical protein
MGVLLCGCCFSSFTAKTNEIILIIANVIAILLLCFCFKIIHWSEIYFINLVLFIAMLLLTLICLIFAILLRYWRGSNVIKTTKKETATKISTADFALTIICFIVCIVEEIEIIISFAKLKVECDITDDEEDMIMYYRRRISTQRISNNISTCNEQNKRIDNEYYISYVTLSYIEIILIFSICIISILKKRIINKTDLNYPVMDGRQVIVVPVQPMGMGMQNNYGYYPQNLNFASSNQVPYSYSTRYMNQQQIGVSSSQNQSQNVSKISMRSKSDVSSNL